MENKVYELLEKLNIEYEKVEYPPLFSGEDNKKYNIQIDAVICKNLFIRNKNKSKYYLIALPLEKRINLKLLQETLRESRLSFGDEEVLEEKLKIKSGAVSIFNIVNVEKTDVVFILDEEILNCDKVAFHPNVNTLSVLFNPDNINKILGHYNVEYKFIKIPL